MYALSIKCMPFLSSVYPLSSTIPKPARILFRFRVRSELDTKTNPVSNKKITTHSTSYRSLFFHSLFPIMFTHGTLLDVCSLDPSICGPPTKRTCCKAVPLWSGATRYKAMQSSPPVFFERKKCTPPKSRKMSWWNVTKDCFFPNKKSFMVWKLSLWLCGEGFRKPCVFVGMQKSPVALLLNWATDTTPFAWAFWFVRCSPHPLSPLLHISKGDNRRAAWNFINLCRSCFVIHIRGVYNSCEWPTSTLQMYIIYIIQVWCIYMHICMYRYDTNVHIHADIYIIHFTPLQSPKISQPSGSASHQRRVNPATNIFNSSLTDTTCAPMVMRPGRVLQLENLRIPVFKRKKGWGFPKTSRISTKSKSPTPVCIF